LGGHQQQGGCRDECRFVIHISVFVAFVLYIRADLVPSSSHRSP
jgi:hypothetical protein